MSAQEVGLLQREKSIQDTRNHRAGLRKGTKNIGLGLGAAVVHASMQMTNMAQ